MTYSAKNPMFRTKDQIIKDVVFALCSNELHFAAKRAILDHALWVWTELDGKYDEKLFWSQAAKESKFKNGTTKGLVHEHVFPRKLFRKMLLEDATTKDLLTVRKLFDEYCFAAIITTDEDTRLNSAGLRSAMPNDWDKKDLWARYKADRVKLI